MHVGSVNYIHAYTLCYICPHSLSELHNLRTLTLSKNDFSNDLPEEVFAGLTSLAEVELSECKLKKIPNRWGASRFSKITDDLYYDMQTFFKDSSRFKKKIYAYIFFIYIKLIGYKNSFYEIIIKRS